jgi:hypothetical protein
VNRRTVPVVVSAVLLGVLGWAPAAAAAEDPFNGAVPGDASGGNATLPPAKNPPGSSPLFENALPGANLTDTRFGPIDDVDRLFLIKVREAGLWERPSCLRAQSQAESPRLHDICQILASDHLALDAEDRKVATALNVGIPDVPNADQQSWMRAFWDKKGHDFDVEAVHWLRLAHGQVFGAIAQVRAGTRNELMRLFAERANDMVNKHMALLESTGLVQYDSLPHAAIGGPAAALANAKVATLDEKSHQTQKDVDAAWTPKNLSLSAPLVVGLLIVAALITVASVRRVVNGD